MSEKSYLKNQVYLPGLSSYDLFTDEEHAAYMQIVEAKNELNRLEDNPNEGEQRKWLDIKKKAKDELTALIKKHEGVPRNVRLRNVIYYPKDADYPFPAGVTWNNMNFSKKISEFSSELTRAMELPSNYTLDQIVVHWKSFDVLHQLVMDGFNMRLLHPDGTTTDKHYHFFTASAGQFGL